MLRHVSQSINSRALEVNESLQKLQEGRRTIIDTIYITNDSWRAQAAEHAQVDRVMVDLEIIGKKERQRGRDTVISAHSISDVARIRSVLKQTKLMVRINPVNTGTREEIDACIGKGADIIMLPMFASPADVSFFIECLKGRAAACLLLETGAALARLQDILAIQGIDEVHVGLNDLHLALNLNFMFELLSGGLVDYIAQVVRSHGIKLGIGGIARVGSRPLSPRLIMNEHVRLGSTQVILSRDFSKIFSEHSRDNAPLVFRRQVRELKELFAHLKTSDDAELEATSLVFKGEVAKIASRYSGGRVAISEKS